MNTINDLKLCESILKVHQLSRDLNRLERDGHVNELWRALAEIHRQSELAMYRMMDLKL